MRSLTERMFSRLLIDPSGCVLWTGAKNSGGYGTISVADRTQFVHRVMYEMFAGPIPDGMQIDHLCRIRHCANVAHLEAVIPAENTHRGLHRNSRKTACIRGHAFNEINTRWRSDGSRCCRICARRRS